MIGLKSIIPKEAILNPKFITNPIRKKLIDIFVIKLSCLAGRISKFADLGVVGRVIGRLSGSFGIRLSSGIERAGKLTT